MRFILTSMYQVQFKIILHFIVAYIGQKQNYITNVKGRFNSGDVNENVGQFFDVIEQNYKEINDGQNSLIEQLYKILSEEKQTISLTLQGSASFGGSPTYNESLSKRRIDSVIEYFKSTKLKTFIEDKKTLTIKNVPEGEGTVIPIGPFGSGEGFKCTTEIKDKNNKVFTKYPVKDMACRRVKIKDIIPTPRTNKILAKVEQVELVDFGWRRKIRRVKWCSWRRSKTTIETSSTT